MPTVLRRRRGFKCARTDTHEKFSLNSKVQLCLGTFGETSARRVLKECVHQAKALKKKDVAGTAAGRWKNPYYTQPPKPPHALESQSDGRPPFSLQKESGCFSLKEGKPSIRDVVHYLLSSIKHRLIQESRQHH